MKIREECMLVDGVETGGLLIGYHVAHTIVLTHATGPGPNAVHRRDFLELDLAYVSGELQRLETTLPVGYEGNWHSHPAVQHIIPSKLDKALLHDVVKSPNYDVETAVLIIVSDAPCGLLDLHPFVFSKGRRRFKTAVPRLCENPFENAGASLPIHRGRVTPRH